MTAGEAGQGVTVEKVSQQRGEAGRRAPTLAPMVHVALVTDHAGSFATVLSGPVPRRIEGGRILVTTLATFDHEDEARTFLRGLRGIDVQRRERTPADRAALERHGVLPGTATDPRAAGVAL